MHDAALPITDHLAELRNRLAWIVGSWLGVSLFCFNQAEAVLGFLVDPVIAALPEGGKLQAIRPTEIFFTYIKCALLAGFILTLPIFFWQLWKFIAPGLYPGEKKAVVPFVLVSSLLFAGGAIFGYEAVFPVVFSFLTSFDSVFVESAWTMQEVFGLTTRLFLAFGIAFELPILVFFLAVSGVLDTKQLLRGTPYAVLIVFVASAMITPPDVVSQVMLGVPMVFLYLLGIAAAWLFGGKRARGTKDEPEP